MGRIVINGIALDPQKDAAELKVRSLLAADSSQSNYILLQTQAPLTEPEKSQLKSLGADLLEYVPENTYIAHYAPTSLEALRALPFVHWANTYMKGFKIAPALHASAAGVQPRLLDVCSTWGAIQRRRRSSCSSWTSFCIATPMRLEP